MFPVVFLWPADTVHWWQAWVVIGLYFVYAIAIGTWLARNDPGLLRERLAASPVQDGQKSWDKALMVLMIPVGMGLFVIPGLDLFRFGWSRALPLWLESGAMVLHLPCFALIGRVMRENTFLARVVENDDTRGQRVITTGPYAIVRHPMYAAVIPLVVAMPLTLGSRWGLIPAALMAALLIFRTVLEDRTLHRELTGYPEYAGETRYRLIPSLW